MVVVLPPLTYRTGKQELFRVFAGRVFNKRQPTSTLTGSTNNSRHSSRQNLVPGLQGPVVFAANLVTNGLNKMAHTEDEIPEAALLAEVAKLQQQLKVSLNLHVVPWRLRLHCARSFAG
jgi:hypothetical protein